MRAYPQYRLIRADAAVVVACWGALLGGVVAFVVTFVLFEIFAVSVPDSVVQAFFACALFLGLLHVVTSLTHRCPNCRKHPTIQGFKPIHEKAIVESGITGWGRVVWDVFRNKPFTCIHCGDVYVARSAV